MLKQKVEREAELEVLKQIFMDGVKEQMKEELKIVRKELKDEVATIVNKVDEKVVALEDKHSEMCDVQSVLDCRVDKLEEEINNL